ncbi:MAG TPA: DUF4350 domain-containing protein [Clostridia bacterium]|nr:DUF4350 domain-containing protein [Clostridia bacterium]
MKNPRLIKRGIIIISISILVIIGVLTITFGKKQGLYPDYSTYSANPAGFKALYLLTGQMGYDTERYVRPSRFLPQNALMVVVNPFQSIIDSEIEQKYLDSWVEKGNILLIIDKLSNIDDYDILKPLKENGNKLENYSSFKKGNGKVIYCSDLKGLKNSNLDNMRSGVDFINALDREGVNDILFNEYYHGFGTRGVTISDLLGESGFLVIIQVIIGIVLLLIISARRFGKPVPVMQVIKRMENENLFALSNLYIKSKSNSIVLQANLQRMKKDISRFLGSNTVLDDEEIVRMSNEYKFLSDMNIQELLKACNYHLDRGKIGLTRLHVLIARIEEVRKGII